MYLAKKILIYILVIFSALPIFYGGNINKAKAATTNQQTTGSNQSSATHQNPKPVTASCGNGCINSGYTIYLQCPTTADINNAATTDNDHYQLTINWSISFTPEDNEYINSAYIEWTGDPNDRQNLDVQKLSGTKSGAATKQLNLNRSYMPSIEVEVYNSNTGDLEGLILSNICLFTKYSSQYQNSTGSQNSGGELGGGGAVNTGTDTTDKCEQQCGTAIGAAVSFNPTGDTIKYALCRMQCAIIDWMGEILGWVMEHVLYPSLGIPMPGSNSTNPQGIGGGSNSGTGGGSNNTGGTGAGGDVVSLAQKAFQEAKAKGVEMTNGPCLGVIKDDWVADVAHNPRQAVDDEPQNQCAEYNNGTVNHFIELDLDGNVIRQN